MVKNGNINGINGNISDLGILMANKGFLLT